MQTDLKCKIAAPRKSSGSQGKKDSVNVPDLEDCEVTVGASGDAEWLGLIGKEKGLIVDAVHGVQELNINMSQFNEDIKEIRFGAKPGSFALFGPSGIWLMLPYTRSFALGRPALNLKRKVYDFNGTAKCQFSGNGRVLGVTNCRRNRVINLWDVDAKGKTCCEVESPRNAFSSFAFSFDGNWLVTVTHQHVELWTLTYGDVSGSGTIEKECRGKLEFKPAIEESFKSFCSLKKETDNRGPQIFLCWKSKESEKSGLLWAEFDISTGEFISEVKREGSTRCRVLARESNKWEAFVWAGKNIKAWDLDSKEIIENYPFDKKSWDQTGTITTISRLGKGTSSGNSVELVRLKVHSAQDDTGRGSSSSNLIPEV